MGDDKCPAIDDRFFFFSIILARMSDDRKAKLANAVLPNLTAFGVWLWLGKVWPLCNYSFIYYTYYYSNVEPTT